MMAAAVGAAINEARRIFLLSSRTVLTLKCRRRDQVNNNTTLATDRNSSKVNLRVIIISRAIPNERPWELIKPTILKVFRTLLDGKE